MLQNQNTFKNTVENVTRIQKKEKYRFYKIGGKKERD